MKRIIYLTIGIVIGILIEYIHWILRIKKNGLFKEDGSLRNFRACDKCGVNKITYDKNNKEDLGYLICKKCAKKEMKGK